MISRTARWLIGSMLVGGAAAYYVTIPEPPVAFQGPPQRAYDNNADRATPARPVEVAALPGVELPAMDAGAGATPAGNPLAALDFDQLNATRERPLFTPSRALPVDPVVEELPTRDFVAEEPAPEPPPAVRLVGLIKLGETGIALLRDENTGTVVRVRSGEDYEGWALRVVDDRSIALARDGEEHVMAMLVPGAPAPRIDAGQPFGQQGYDQYGNPVAYDQYGNPIDPNGQNNGMFPMDVGSPAADGPGR